MSNDMPLSLINKLFMVVNYELYWKIKPNKSRDISKPITRANSEGYLLVEYNSKRYRVHRILYQIYNNIDTIPDDMLIDHIDGNVVNNTPNNLRLSNKSTNGMNRSKQLNNTSGFKGVTYHAKARKYMAQLHISNNNYYLGLHDTAEKAYEVYCKKGIELHGEFFHS